MPKTYLCPTRPNVLPGTTSYRTFLGGGSLFEMTKDTHLREVTDGLSNTLLAVESLEAIPWTRPEGLAFDPKAPPSFFGAGSMHPGGFNAVFADGSVRFISSKVDLGYFRKIITKAGGEVVEFPR